MEPTYWLFSKSDANQALSEAVDEALNTLIENGTLAAIGEEYLGGDYSTEEALRSRLGGGA